MPFINRYRLPLKISKAQFPIAREVFTKSNGATVVLSAVISKTYQGETDYLPEKLHERIVVALSHDTVNIEGEKYLGGIVLNGEYSPSWPDFLDYPLAKASFEVLVSPFAARNTNCGTCTEYSQVVTEDDNIGTVGEDETVIVAILYNDAICCSPFEISVVTFNTTYLDSANVVDNTLVIHTKTGIPIQNSVILATYRVTCENGMYDEANVIANVAGSVEECLSPTDLAPINITSTTARGTWQAPDPAPACGYIWRLYLLSDLGTPVDSGTTMDTFVDFVDLEPDTEYQYWISADCCEGDESPFVVDGFLTQPASESGICGQYSVEFQDSCGNPLHYADVTYLDCNDSYQSMTVFYLSPQTVCMKQTSPGSPIYYEVTFTNAPPECLVGIIANYIGEC